MEVLCTISGHTLKCKNMLLFPMFSSLAGWNADVIVGAEAGPLVRTKRKKPQVKNGRLIRRRSLGSDNRRVNLPAVVHRLRLL
jgi:hypothetical protein